MNHPPTSSTKPRRSLRSVAPPTPLSRNAKPETTAARTAREALSSPSMKAPPKRSRRKQNDTMTPTPPDVFKNGFGTQLQHTSPPPPPCATSPIRLKKTKHQQSNSSTHSTTTSSSSSSGSSINTSSIKSVCVKKKLHMHTLRVQSQEQSLSLGTTAPPRASSNMPTSASSHEACLVLSRMKTSVNSESFSAGVAIASVPEESATNNQAASTTTSTARAKDKSSLERPISNDSSASRSSSNSSNVTPKRPTIGSPKTGSVASKDSSGTFDGLMEAADDMWNALVMSGNDVVGYQINPTSDDMEPIPYSVLIAGAPVEADDLSSAVESAMLAPFGMTHEEFMSDDVVEDHQKTAPTHRPLRGKNLTSLQQQPSSAQQQQKTRKKATPRASATHGSTRKSTSSSKVTTRSNKRKKSEVSSDVKAPARPTKTRKVQDAPEEAKVGPDTWQMMVLYRMIIYLEETAGRDNAQHAKVFRSVVAKCKAFHLAGSQKFLHLPGAVFEEMVEIIGGPTFLQIYNAAKTFEHPRLQEAFTDNEVLVAGPNTTLQAIKITDGHPNLLQLSVAYGYHLAQTMDTSNSNSNSGSLKEMLEQGAHDVLNLDEAARLQFWASTVEASENEAPKKKFGWI